jgi:hypothetical protein
MTAGPAADSLSIFLPDFEAMSAEEGLAFIARIRRQLDRFHCLPGGFDGPIDPADATAIARLCDELEASIRSHYHRPT